MEFVIISYCVVSFGTFWCYVVLSGIRDLMSRVFSRDVLRA